MLEEMQRATRHVAQIPSALHRADGQIGASFPLEPREPSLIWLWCQWGDVRLCTIGEARISRQLHWCQQI